MKPLVRILSAIAALSLASFVAVAQELPVVRRTFSPEDSLSMNQIKTRLREIHRKRPAVALVLSGGGAKGAAHVGVIKYLESIDMPVDLIVGTSMGGLVGGMYALGYDADSLETLMKTINWSHALTDDVSRENISYSDMRRREQYVISFPFYYANKNKEDAAVHAGDMTFTEARKERKIKLGADSKESSSALKNNFLGSLPSGYMIGQNVFNVINSLSVGYQDSLLFSSLPIPFVCVATDLVEGRGVYMMSGKLATALRSTMSIPGMFAPVKLDNMVLVDGGMRDNYPVSIARELGADIVIGVDLSGDSWKEFEDVNNILDIVNQGIDMLGRPAYEVNVKQLDVNIKPDVKGFNMMSFEPESIETLIKNGYEAAQSHAETLAGFKRHAESATTVLYNKPAVDINTVDVRIDGIELRGVDGQEAAILEKKIKDLVSDTMGKEEIESVVARIFGTQAFDYVTYELSGEEEPYHLIINCKEGPVHNFGLGLRLDTEEIVSVLLDVGLYTRRLKGHTVDFTGKISVNPSLKVHYSYDAPKCPTLNVAVAARWTSINLFDAFSTYSGISMQYFNTWQAAYLSNVKWSLFDINLGIKNNWFSISNMMAKNFIVGDYDLKQLSNNYLSLFLNSRADTFDNGYFPTKGFTTGLSYEWVFAGFPNKYNSFHVCAADIKGVVYSGKVFSFIPSLNVRFLFGDNIPIAYMNAIGGSLAGRYLDQQIAFIGKNNIASTKKILSVLRTDFRFNLAKNHYLTGIFNYARDGETFVDYVSSGELGWFGAGVEYAYNAFFGPVVFDVHWSNLSHSVGVYLGIGYNF
ncbi:MAG: patatin-like phospholipase family protein [Candidatus Cryptobacteroides sp.]